MKATPQRRRKGEGSIVQLPNGNWKATITIGRGIDGKQKRRAVTASSKPELMNKLSLLRLDKTPAQAREMTLGQLYNEFEREALRDKTASTKSTYTVLWNRLKNDFANVKLSKLTPNFISSVLLSLKNRKEKGADLANNTLLLSRRLLSAIFNFAITKEYITKNPCAGVLKGIKGTRKADLEVITKEQLETLLEDAKHYDKYIKYNASIGIHWYPLILFASATGLRRGELLGLRKSAIDVENGIIDVRAQIVESTPDLPLKTQASYRKIHVNETVLAIVLADSDPESDFLFANRKTHKNLSLSTTSSAFQTFLNFYGHKPFDKFGLHDLRHYHATVLISSGLIDIKSVSRRLGHSDVRTTLERYAHWLPEVDERAKDILGIALD